MVSMSSSLLESGNSMESLLSVLICGQLCNFFNKVSL